MSLINDALRQARKSAPPNLPSTMQPLQPVADQPSFVPAWFWTSLVTLLVAGAIFFIGWAVVHRHGRAVVVRPKPAVAAPAVAATAKPNVKPAAVAITPAPVARPAAVAVAAAPVAKPPVTAFASVPVAKPPVAAAVSVPAAKPQPAPATHLTLPLNPPGAPKLQGIFYSTNAPSAIVDGKSVRPGTQFGEYRVKAISRYAVTLIGPDKKEFQISLGN
jgi:hypothetical protein